MFEPTQFILTVFMSLFSLRDSLMEQKHWIECDNCARVISWTFHIEIHSCFINVTNWLSRLIAWVDSCIWYLPKKQTASCWIPTDTILPFYLMFWHLTQECYLVSFIWNLKMLFETLAVDASHLVVAHLLSPASQFKWVENKKTFQLLTRQLHVIKKKKKPFTLILEHNYFFSDPL